MVISNHIISGKTKFIAHIGFPTHSFTAPKILNPCFKLLNKNGIIILHRHKDEEENLPINFKIVENKKYGISKIIFISH